MEPLKGEGETVSLLRELGIGAQRIIAQDNWVPGVVTSAETCWMIKVNKSAFRTHPLDEAAFPHFIRFRYTVNGTEYTGGRFFDAFTRCPMAGEILTVYVDEADPSKYAVQVQ